MSEQAGAFQPNTVANFENFRLNFVPGWLRSAIVRSIRLPRHRQRAWPALWAAAELNWSNRWIDHLGTAVWRGRKVFVSQPYALTREDRQAIRNLCQSCGLSYILLVQSDWNPPATKSVVIFRPNPKGAGA